MHEVILRMEKINKTFPGIVALDEVDLDIIKGEVHVLLGENGAGKSTLMKILSGVYTKDSGSIYIEGKKVEFNNPRQAEEHGICMIYQEPELVSSLTVYENIFLGNEIMQDKVKFHISNKAMYEQAKKILRDMGMDINGQKKAKYLSPAQKQMVQLARALINDPKIIIMDEPTASLTEMEIEILFSIIQKIKSSGKSVIYISHRLNEVKNVGDRATILKDGRVVGTKIVSSVETDSLIKMMLGKDLMDRYPKLPIELGEETFRLSKLTTNIVRNVSFELHKGETIGIAGLVGSGRTNLARAIFGMERILEGQIFINSKEARITSPRDSIKNGIGFVTENRTEQGLVLQLSVAKNITMVNIDCVTERRIINYKKENSIANDFIRRLGIKTNGIQQKALYLSGGNQQKVILAKWMLSKARIFIFDEPTRGIDIGGKVEVYNLMNELSRKGASIIMVSSEFSELMGMCNKIIVLNKGQMVLELDRSEFSQEKIFNYAFSNSSSI